MNSQDVTGSHSAEPIDGSKRIEVLDILRGIALLGMFVVHFIDFGSPPTGAIERGIQQSYDLFLEGRFYTIFAILFGVGFAIQLNRADAHGERFVLRYLRRLVALALFGLIAEVGFGFLVLVAYAIWGLPLLLVRRWSLRALLALAIVCTAFPATYTIARASYSVWRVGNSQAVTNWTKGFPTPQAAGQQLQKRLNSSDFKTVIAARVEHLTRYVSRNFWVTMGQGVFVKFLLGVLALRLGIFERPRERRRLIVGLALFGIASWAISAYVLPMLWQSRPPSPGESLIGRVALNQARFFVGSIISGSWLSFAYMGAVLLLVARNAAWLYRLAPFAWVGRMALSNYMLQVVVLSLLFQQHTLGHHLPLLAAPLCGLALFIIQALLSKWWLSRYRYGPLEWLWRSATYWKRQRIRLDATVLAV